MAIELKSVDFLEPEKKSGSVFYIHVTMHRNRFLFK